MGVWGEVERGLGRTGVQSFALEGVLGELQVPCLLSCALFPYFTNYPIDVFSRHFARLTSPFFVSVFIQLFYLQNNGLIIQVLESIIV